MSTVYEFVAADVTDIHISTATEVPFILDSRERDVDTTCSWYTVASVTDTGDVVFTQHPMPGALCGRELADKPSPEIFMDQHALLHTSRQLRQELVSVSRSRPRRELSLTASKILQSSATRPVRIEATIIDYDFTHLLRQLANYGSQGITASKDLPGPVSEIFLYFKRGKATNIDIARNFQLLKQHITLHKMSAVPDRKQSLVSCNGIQYEFHLQTEYALRKTTSRASSSCSQLERLWTKPCTSR